jgi:elongation factor G
MANMDLKDKRNVAFVAHHGAGKTTLVEAMLYSLGKIDRMGRVEDGNTFADYTEEERDRKITVYSSMIMLRPKGTAINVIDTPGFSDFAGEVKSAMRVADGGLIVINATSGVEVETEKFWSYAEEYSLPRMAVINQLDKERTSLQGALDSLAEHFDVPFIPLQLPIGTESDFKGIVDLIKMKAYYFDDKGKTAKSEDIPADMADEATEAREALIDRAAEYDESVMEKFLEGEELSKEEIIAGLRGGIKECTFVPAVCCSATKLVGISTLIDAISDFLPSPLDSNEVSGHKPDSEDEVTITPDGTSLCAQIYKSTIDPFAGKLAYVRIYSGILESEKTYLNSTNGKSIRVHALLEINGKNTKNIQSAEPGDIVALAKLDDLTAGDTLCDEGNPIVLKPVEFPKPTIMLAVKSKEKGDEDKVSQAITRIAVGDRTLSIRRDSETHEMVLVGQGEMQMTIAKDRLKKEFKLEVEMVVPKVPYRETIMGKSEGSYRHRKQSGGRGQFAEVHLRMAPKQRGEGNEFLNKVVGGSVPTRFIPAVEKGVNEALVRGIQAGFLVVDVECTVFYGKDHPVDSSEMAFKLATMNCYRDVAMQCKPILLEPIYDMVIRVPEDYMGDIMGDLNTKRGRVQGMDADGKHQIIRAQIPLAEAYRYSVDLRSITRGRGSFTMDFSHYDAVPGDVALKVIEATKKEKEEE